MKKLLFLNFGLFACVYSNAQTFTFTTATPQPNLIEAWGGAFASGDMDGDGDKDLFMTGITPAKSTKLYFNDGIGNFTEVSANFPNSGTSQAILKDLDNDADLDLFFSGNNNLSQNFTNIYRNNGLGIFTQVPNTLPAFIKGAAIDDVDNDGDQDIVISASTSSTNFVADVYLNNGNAIFTAQGSSAFTAVSGALEFIDIENDGDKDVIISGADVNNVNSTKLYLNNGAGIFTLDNTATFAAIEGVDIDVADTDNDGDFDVLLNGDYGNFLYINDGAGNFSLFTTILQQTYGGENAFNDLDNDGDQDLLIVGTQVGGLPNIYNILYQNNGSNQFVPVDTLGGEYIADCVIEDFTGDGFKDIIIQGFAFKTNVYWNTPTSVGKSEQITSNTSILFYPNPTKDFINLNLNENVGYASLFNAQGQEVLSQQVNSKQLILDISTFQNGIYFARFNANKSQVFKIQKY